MIGEKFEQAANFSVPAQQRQHDDGRNAQRPASSRFTRGSDSALSQRSNCLRAMLSAVNPERTCNRAPSPGAEAPALARHTISSRSAAQAPLRWRR